jgi:hypothetical protein
VFHYKPHRSTWDQSQKPILSGSNVETEILSKSEPHTSTDSDNDTDTTGSETGLKTVIEGPQPLKRKDIRKAKRDRKIERRLMRANKKREQRLHDLRILEDPYALYDILKVGALLKHRLPLDLTVGARRVSLRVQLDNELVGHELDRQYIFSVSTKYTRLERYKDNPRRQGLDLNRGTPSIASLERSDNSNSGSQASTATLSGASLSSVHTGATVWSDTTLGTSDSGDSASSSNSSRGSIWSWLPRTKRSRRTWSANESDSSSNSSSNTSSNQIAGGPVRGSRSQEWSRWRWPRRRRVTR